MAVRGRQQPGRTGVFPADKPLRATVMLKPGDYVRGLYEELVQDMGISGAEVLREALMELHKREARRKARQTAKAAASNHQELPQTG
ncbi:MULTISPECIES: hypothetical protein [unclassified Streptomyces]|uniref:hypothetical protein n=1 Tax=unclassified Streptomyces TaxID=2593676 RepID=UPI0013BEDF2D|nr:hypothetical protein [Streptomyces sp. VN1]NEB60321.1 hypothetical protein [Streptomyces diastaticus]NEB60355.1 hypothetical protein [Streptomyces diastaticus]QIP74749.1 hypothetical protein EZV63_36980 [Streptomyces sp. VN1]